MATIARNLPEQATLNDFLERVELAFGRRNEAQGLPESLKINKEINTIATKVFNGESFNTSALKQAYLHSNAINATHGAYLDLVNTSQELRDEFIGIAEEKATQDVELIRATLLEFVADYQAIDVEREAMKRLNESFSYRDEAKGFVPTSEHKLARVAVAKCLLEGREVDLSRFDDPSKTHGAYLSALTPHQYNEEYNEISAANQAAKKMALEEVGYIRDTLAAFQAAQPHATIGEVGKAIKIQDGKTQGVGK